MGEGAATRSYAETEIRLICYRMNKKRYGGTQ
jgi:hypothetical protein